MIYRNVSMFYLLARISLSSVLAELTFEHWIVSGRSISDAYRRAVKVDFQIYYAFHVS